MSSYDDEESADAAEIDPARPLDLSPASGPGGPGPRRSSTRTYVAVAVLVVLLGGLGVVVFNGLTDAATFYYNVDEAVAKRDELGDQRFRMQGNAVAGSISQTDDGVEFVLAFGDATVPVVHHGDPPELFDDKIPVIIEGSFEGGTFVSDEILIRHDSTYEEENSDRLLDAETDAQRRSGGAG